MGIQIISNLRIIIVALGLLSLVLTLYFLSKTMELYGGKIGQSLNFIGFGIFAIAVNETLSFVKVIFDYDILGLIIKNADVMTAVQYGLNLLAFTFFAYGFYTLSNAININKK